MKYEVNRLILVGVQLMGTNLIGGANGVLLGDRETQSELSSSVQLFLYLSPGISIRPILLLFF